MSLSNSEEISLCNKIYEYKLKINNILCSVNVSSDKSKEAEVMDKELDEMIEFAKENFKVIFDYGWITVEQPPHQQPAPDGYMYFRNWRKKLLSQQNV